MGVAGLDGLHGALRSAGDQVIGPTVRDGAIVLAELASAGELPFGWGVELALAATGSGSALTPPPSPTRPGRSRGSSTCIRPARSSGRCAARTARSRSPRPASRRRRWPSSGSGPATCARSESRTRCSARVSTPSSRYASRRAGIFIVAVNCTEPGETCFCTSMGTGPEAGEGYDLALTELAGAGEHQFLVDVGSPAGPTSWPASRSPPPASR